MITTPTLTLPGSGPFSLAEGWSHRVGGRHQKKTFTNDSSGMEVVLIARVATEIWRAVNQEGQSRAEVACGLGISSCRAMAAVRVTASRLS
jgi:hypothetical protein